MKLLDFNITTLIVVVAGMIVMAALGVYDV
jgi:hypothetical protein